MFDRLDTKPAARPKVNLHYFFKIVELTADMRSGMKGSASSDVCFSIPMAERMGRLIRVKAKPIL